MKFAHDDPEIQNLVNAYNRQNAVTEFLNALYFELLQYLWTPPAWVPTPISRALANVRLSYLVMLDKRLRKELGLLYEIKRKHFASVLRRS